MSVLHLCSKIVFTKHKTHTKKCVSKYANELNTDIQYVCCANWLTKILAELVWHSLHAQRKSSQCLHTVPACCHPRPGRWEHSRRCQREEESRWQLKSLLLHLSPSGRPGHRCLGIERGDHGGLRCTRICCLRCDPQNISPNQMQWLSGRIGLLCATVCDNKTHQRVKRHRAVVDLRVNTYSMSWRSILFYPHWESLKYCNFAPKIYIAILAFPTSFCLWVFLLFPLMGSMSPPPHSTLCGAIRVCRCGVCRRFALWTWNVNNKLLFPKPNK